MVLWWCKRVTLRTYVRLTDIQPPLSRVVHVLIDSLRCPETLFISRENANFLFSVFRVVQGEAKTPKIMECCRANFAFLHALKIGTFRGKWTVEWVFKTSHFFRLALYFLINSKLAFSLHVSQRCLAGTAKSFELERRTVQKITFCLFVRKPL